MMTAWPVCASSSSSALVVVFMVCMSFARWSGAMCLRCFVYCKPHASPDLVVLLGYIYDGIVDLWCTDHVNCNY